MTTGNRFLAAALLLVGCTRAPPAEKRPPAAMVDKKVVEGDLAKVTLTPEAETRLGLTVVPVEARSVVRRRLAGGEVVLPSGGALALAAPVAATVSSTKATAGKRVRKGDALVRLVPLAPVDRDLRAQAERQAATAEARFAAAKAKLERSERMLADGAGSARLVEEARAERDVAKADADAAKQRLSVTVGQPLSADVAVTIKAPFDGVVRQVGASRGQLVTAGAMLVEVVSDEGAWVRVPLFVAEARRIRADAPAVVSAFGGKERREAMPAVAPPGADPIGGTVDFVYALADARGFRPGERVEVELQTDDAGSALVVPLASVLRDVEGGAWVYEQIAPHTFTHRRVVVAHVAGDVVELAGGPKAGTPVVREGANELWGVELGAGK